WSVGLESGSASGWPGADWIQEIFLKKYGPKLYTDWWQGKLKWTSPQVKDAFRTWGQIVADPKMTYGGNQYELSTNFGSAFTPVFQTPPNAYFHEQASFIQSFIQKAFPSLQSGSDFSFFAFPSIDPRYANAVQMAGNLVSEFNKTPQAEAFVRYFASAPAQAYWVRAADALSPNRAVPLSDYPGTLFKEAGKILTSATIAQFSADDLMPSQMESAFWSAVMSYVQNPGQLDAILTHLDQVQQSAYKNS
ncbi:MAG TPA: carbohydrate ABC transporter substrate-binding protein, partial [Spirochaetia bacterium]|nr:carbohydrate ABC transporter substrate-binding protein [Spirochaetia bacterium]